MSVRSESLVSQLEDGIEPTRSPVFVVAEGFEDNLKLPFRSDGLLNIVTSLRFSMSCDQLIEAACAEMQKIENAEELRFDGNMIVQELPNKTEHGYSIFELKNQEKWIAKPHLPRIKGSLFVEKLIEQYDLKTIRMAPHKIIRRNPGAESLALSIGIGEHGFLTINSSDYMIFSKLIPQPAGSLTPEEREEINFLESMGVCDVMTFNFRRGEDGLLYYIDSHSDSFNFKDLLVPEEKGQYDQIVAAAEKANLFPIEFTIDRQCKFISRVPQVKSKSSVFPDFPKEILKTIMQENGREAFFAKMRELAGVSSVYNDEDVKFREENTAINVEQEANATGKKMLTAWPEYQVRTKNEQPNVAPLLKADDPAPLSRESNKS